LRQRSGPAGCVEAEQSLDSPCGVAKEGVLGKYLAAKFWKILKITG